MGASAHTPPKAAGVSAAKQTCPLYPKSIANSSGKSIVAVAVSSTLALYEHKVLGKIADCWPQTRSSNSNFQRGPPLAS